MITQQELDKYIELLKNTDWYYQYAEGDAYYKGQASFQRASAQKHYLLDKYPQDAEQINKLWENHGHAQD